MGTLRELSRPRRALGELLFLTYSACLLLGNGPVSARRHLEPTTESKHELKPTEPIHVGWTHPATQPPQGFTEPQGPQETPQKPQEVTEGSDVVSTAVPQETSLSVIEPVESTVPSVTTHALDSTTERSTVQTSIAPMSTETSTIETTTSKLPSLGSTHETRTTQLLTSQQHSTEQSRFMTTSPSHDHSTAPPEMSLNPTTTPTFSSTPQQENTSPMQTTARATQEHPHTTRHPPTLPPEETPEPQPTPHWPHWPTMPNFPTEEPNPPIETKKPPSSTKPSKPTRAHDTVPPRLTQTPPPTEIPQHTRPSLPTDRPRSTKRLHPTVGSESTTQIPQDKTPMPHPAVFIQLFLQALWQDVCPSIQDSLESLAYYSEEVLQLFYLPTVKLLNDTANCPLDAPVHYDMPVGETSVQLDLCILSAETEMCDPLLTQRLGVQMQLDKDELQTYLNAKVLAVNVYGAPGSTAGPREHGSSAVAIGIPLTIIFLLVVCVATIIFHKIYRKRLDKHHAMHIHYYCDGKSHGGLSESHQLSPLHNTTYSTPIAAAHQLVPAVNKGLVMDDEETDTQNYPSHVLSMHGLSQFYCYLEAIVEEFETLPDFQSSPTRPRASSKSSTLTSPNLFLPPSKTRVSLQKASSDNQHGFLNASFVKGYGKAKYSYIATTAPWGTNLADFWEMVWEQQSRTIICLCSPAEMGVVCPWYWPRDEGIQSAQLYGDILIMRQGCVLTENYSMSTLLIKNIQNSLCRPINHFWFTQWSPVSTDVPSSPTVLLSFLLQVRQTVQETYGPIVVHCSDGFSRTGTLVAIDTAMRGMEDLCTVDVPSIVCCVRRDRGAAVLERNHYAFIYKALYEYSVMLTRGLADGMAAEDDEADAEASFC